MFRGSPLRKLTHTVSSSSLQTSPAGNRSSSSLTSREAEFQAWKRRKNYDPLKSAASRSNASRKVSTQSTHSAISTQSAQSAQQQVRQSPQHKRIQVSTVTLVTRTVEC